MSILKTVLQFLTGKDAEIFDDEGNVCHKLPKKKWETWHNRTKLDPEHNWRNHTGIKAGAQTKK